MQLYNSIFGSVYVRLITSAPEQTITILNNNGITLYYVKRIDEITLEAVVRRKDISSLKRICNSRGEVTETLRKSGLWWRIIELKKRPVLITTCILFLLLTIFLPSRILFVQVEGNQNINSESILESAAACGIEFGAIRRKIRSEQFKNRILEMLPDLQWASINTRGCVATISVRERNLDNNKVDHVTENSIVASRDGVIQSLTVTQGNPMCNIGDVVKEGQILISGYTDLGSVVLLAPAEGEVFAETTRFAYAITPSEYRFHVGIKKKNVKFSILVGKKLINLFKDSGISGACCGRIYKKYQITLPGGFQLPLSLIQYTDIIYEVRTESVKDTAHFQWFNTYIKEYLGTQMIAGVIRSESVLENMNGSVYLLEGVYDCNEMIGKKSNKEFTEEYGKRD